MNANTWLNNKYLEFLSVGAILAFSAGYDFAAHAGGESGQDESAIFKMVQERAAVLAAEPYKKQSPDLPAFFASLDYDQYRDIRFQPDQSLWLKERLPFQVQFFSRASIFGERVLINIIEQNKPVPVEFRPEMFDFGRLSVPTDVPGDLGFAGFRLHYPLNKRNYFDEVAAFLGASYFRAVGRRQVYGLSARGLALNTAHAKGEEFPVFQEFWLEKPPHKARLIIVYALMDSPSVSGAYRFVIKPAAATVIEVKAHLYFRDDVELLGVAPLTSMFYHGKTTQKYIDDFRPEVHDSDGLYIVAGNGEHLWRPLNNPLRLATSYFHIDTPRAFGLLQRERNFSAYQDLEASYQKRPGAWVEPIGDWGSGTVELVEIPTDDEYHDNIVAFWVPAESATAGTSRTFEYKLTFGDKPGIDPRLARSVSTRTGAGAEPKSSQRKFVIDFVGEQLGKLKDASSIVADISSSTGTPGKAVIQSNPFTRGYRVYFDFTPGSEPLAELRCNLRSGTDVLSETWTYQWRSEEH
ncbi:MAG: glucan biosynthesis protein [Gammaproteobacteria bacterium]|jgi:glucans biosynthesis protein